MKKNIDHHERIRAELSSSSGVGFRRKSPRLMVPVLYGPHPVEVVHMDYV